MLGKLHFPDEVDKDKIRTLKLLLNTLQRVSCCFIQSWSPSDYDTAATPQGCDDKKRIGTL